MKNNHAKFIKESLPFWTIKNSNIWKIPSMFQLKKSQSSKDYSDYTTIINKTPLGIKSSTKKKNRGSLVKWGSSRLQKKTFSSIWKSKERNQVWSDTASLLSEFSSK